MSMTSALNNAISGLGAVGRSAQQVSSNIANALTPGYGVRELLQSSAAAGGVRQDGIHRVVDAVVLSDRRLADAEVAQGAVGVDFLSRLYDQIGAPDDPASLTGRLSTIEGRLIEASSRPDSTPRLQAVVDGANDLVHQINAIGQGIQLQRQGADAAIAQDVNVLNSTLKQVEKLNAAIARSTKQEEPVAALMDQRQILIDQIADIVPLRQISRDRGAVALMTTGGQILLDTRAATFEFSQVNAVTSAMTFEGGQLSGLSVNGTPITMNTGAGRMDGGRLAANFELRDTLATRAQTDLDGFVRDLIQRFEAPAVDPSRAVGAPGLFTDAGAALAVAPAVGLAQRLSLNALVDPEHGGIISRLRDGLGSGGTGPVGNAALLQSLSDALTEPRTNALGLTLSASQYASELAGRNSAELFRAEQAQTFRQTHADILREQELSGGVDTDQEMQKLLLIEQAYGANARVIQAVDDMMRRLLEI